MRECRKGRGCSERRGENKLIKPPRFFKAGKAYFLLKKLAKKEFPLSTPLRVLNLAVMESNYRE